jgi:hypothetical protein
MTSRLRHYVGLKTTESKLARLLEDFEYQGMGPMVEKLKLGLTEIPIDSLVES